MYIVRQITILILSCFVLLCGIMTSFGQTSDAEAKYTEIFRSVWETVNERFYDPGFTGVDWKSVGERYRPEVESIKNDVDFLELMGKMLAELPVSHLQISMPRGSSLVGTGARTNLIDGLTVVVSVPEGSDAQAKGVRRGDVVLNPSDEIGPMGSYADMRLRGCDGSTRTLKVHRESHFQPERPSIRWRTFSTGTGKRVGYLRAVRFDDDAAPLVDAAMAELRNADSLIVDVRDNTGGNMSFVRLSSYFAEGEHLVAALLNRSYLETRGTSPGQIDPAKLAKASKTYTDESIFDAMSSNGGAVGIYSEDLGDKRYKGRVIVLINEETASAAEGFAWHVKLRTGAKLVGRRTAGALLGAEYFTLPGGWRLAVPTHSGWGPDGKPVIDEPVLPHIETTWSLRDFCGGTDPDMAKALELIGVWLTAN